MNKACDYNLSHSENKMAPIYSSGCTNQLVKDKNTAVLISKYCVCCVGEVTG